MDELSIPLTSGEFIACTVLASQMYRHLYVFLLLFCLLLPFCFPPHLPPPPLLLSPPFPFLTPPLPLLFFPPFLHLSPSFFPYILSPLLLPSPPLFLLSPPFFLFPSPLAASRLQKVLQSSRGRVVVGGETNPSSRYIAPTVLSDVEETDPVMTEEVGLALTLYMSCWWALLHNQPTPPPLPLPSPPSPPVVWSCAACPHHQQHRGGC